VQCNERHIFGEAEEQAAEREQSEVLSDASCAPEYQARRGREVEQEGDGERDGNGKAFLNLQQLVQEHW
jgi:hypothetical protein